MEPVPAEGEIRIVESVPAEVEPELEGGPVGLAFDEAEPEGGEIRITAKDWLDEVSVEDGTMEWTAAQGDGIGRRERIDTPRVRHLFQVPEDADWEVRELDYDHYSRRAG